MIAELKEKSQVTIPSKVVKELGLRRGDLFEVVTHKGTIQLVPVVVYPKERVEELERLAADAHAKSLRGELETFDTVADLIADLDAE